MRILRLHTVSLITKVRARALEGATRDRGVNGSGSLAALLGFMRADDLYLLYVLCHISA